MRRPRAGVALALTGLVLAGIPAENAGRGIPPNDIVGGQLAVSSVFGASSAAWTHAVRVFAAGLLDLAALITHELDLTEFGPAIRLLAGGRDDVGKVLLRP